MNKISIAIDGFSGCGKSTLARDLARELGYSFVDTGAMYRGITHLVIEHGGENEAAIEAVLSTEPKLTFGEGNELFINGDNVEKQIRSSSIADRVSDVSASAEVRHYLKLWQMEIGMKGGVIMEGRDIGSIIMPEAELKLFITASMEVRIQRRLKQLQEAGENPSEDDVRRNLERRDNKDITRAMAPLRLVSSAIVLDTSNLTLASQVAAAKAIAMPRIDREGLLGRFA